MINALVLIRGNAEPVEAQSTGYMMAFDMRTYVNSIHLNANVLKFISQYMEHCFVQESFEVDVIGRFSSKIDKELADQHC